jgi:putative transcriptional regulator
VLKKRIRSLFNDGCGGESGQTAGGKKMTSRALAAFVGITEQNLSLLKSGKVKGIRFDTLSRICEALECQPGDILAWEPD